MLIWTYVYTFSQTTLHGAAFNPSSHKRTARVSVDGGKHAKNLSVKGIYQGIQWHKKQFAFLYYLGECRKPFKFVVFIRDLDINHQEKHERNRERHRHILTWRYRYQWVVRFALNLLFGYFYTRWYVEYQTRRIED